MGENTGSSKRIFLVEDEALIALSEKQVIEKDYVEGVKSITSYGYVLKGSGEFVLIESITMAFELFGAHRKTREQEQQYELAITGVDLGVWKHPADRNTLVDAIK